METSENVSQEYEYIHFVNINHRDMYLINNTHLKVSYMCCGGKGIAIERMEPIMIPTPIPIPNPKTVGTCDICFLDNIELENRCQTCIHPFCKECLDKVVSKVCPYCRGKLS